MAARKFSDTRGLTLHIGVSLDLYSQVYAKGSFVQCQSVLLWGKTVFGSRDPLSVKFMLVCLLAFLLCSGCSLNS